jgi:hypothetical protein
MVSGSLLSTSPEEERDGLDPLLHTRSSAPLNSDASTTYGSVAPTDEDFETSGFSRPVRSWSMHAETSSILPTLANKSEAKPKSSAKKPAKGGFFYYLIFAIVNVIIGVPGLCK